MGKTFSDSEKNVIVKELKKSAALFIAKYGMKKTSVEMLADAAHIAKGSFYSFYPSKEVLFFELLEDYHETVRTKLTEYLEDKKKSGRVTREDIIYIVFNIMSNIDDKFLSAILDPKEFNYLVRKLPPEVIEAHLKGDDETIKLLAKYMRLKDGIDINLIASCARGIFMMLLHKDEIGVDYLKALELVFTGFINEITEE